MLDSRSWMVIDWVFSIIHENKIKTFKIIIDHGAVMYNTGLISVHVSSSTVFIVLRGNCDLHNCFAIWMLSDCK